MSVATCSKLAVKKETTFGTEATGTYKSTEAESSDLNGIGTLLTKDTFNGFSVTNGAVRGQYSVEGSIDMLSNPGGIIPVLVEGIMGNVATTDLGGGAYQHVFSATTGCAALPSYSIYMDKLAGKFKYIGCKVGSMTLNAATPDFTKLSFGIMGQYDKETTAPTISTSNRTPFTWADAAVTIDSVTDTSIENFTAEFSRDMEMVWTMNNQNYPGKIQEKRMAVTGTFTKEFETMAQYRTFWGAVGATQVQRTLLDDNYVITFTSLDQIAASGQYYTLQFDFKKLYLESLAVPIASNDRITQDIAFMCVLDESTSEFVDITIINDEATI